MTQGFNLMKFEKIISNEIDSIMEEMEGKQREDKYTKKGKPIKIEDIAGEKLVKTLEYYHKHVFKTTQGNYFVQKTADDKFITPMSAKTFNEVYGQTMKEFHPHLLKRDTVRYEVDIYDENFTIDKKGKRINLSQPFNFEFTSEPTLTEENELIDYIFDEFIFKVICASNKTVYEYVLDMISCYAHRKQTNIVLILVGDGGTGKSKFIEFLQAMFGQSCKMMSDQVMSGQDMFNSSMVGTSIGYIEETNGKGESNYIDIQRTLKRLSTAKYITCRKMQTDSFDVINLINFVVVTNFIKDIKHDRRNLPLEPSTHRINDRDFFSKVSAILNNGRLMQGCFNRLYNRKFDVWAREIPKTDILQDFTEKNVMRMIHEFFIDEMIHNTAKEKYDMPSLFDMYKGYLMKHGKDMRVSETIFKHECRQFLTKLELSTGNKIWYDTSIASITENLHKRKITNEMIEARKPADFDFDQQEQENDPVQELQKANLKLTNLIEEQAKEIEELKRLLNEKHVVKTKSKTEEPVKKISKQLLKDFAKVKNMI